MSIHICLHCQFFDFKDQYVTDLGKRERVESCDKNHFTQLVRSMCAENAKIVTNCRDFEYIPNDFVPEEIIVPKKNGERA